MLNKVCKICRIEKPLEDFINDSRLKSGKGARCKDCRNAISRSKAYHKTKKKTPEAIERQKQYGREWSKRNRAKKRESFTKWQKANPEKAREINHLRRVRIKGQKFYIRKKELQRLYRQPCFLCHSLDKITMDHIIPLSLGGRHSIGNLMPLCQTCNSRKSNKLLVFIRYQSHIERG